MAAPARPYWTGYLKLSLVTIAVRLYTASSERERVRFHQIHEPSGERVRQQLVVPGIGPVERDDIVKGFEYQKGHYVTVDPEDLKRLRLETTDTIDITEFVESVDPIYFDAPYYLVPDGNVAEEGYRVIRESLRQSGKIAVGQVVINGQERIIAIRPLGTGLLGNALRYQDEIRKPEDFFGSIAADDVDEDQLAIMEQIIARKTKAFDQGAGKTSGAPAGPGHQSDGGAEAQPGRGTEITIGGAAPCREPAGRRGRRAASGVTRPQDRRAERPAQPLAAGRRRPRPSPAQRRANPCPGFGRSAQAPPQSLLIGSNVIPAKAGIQGYRPPPALDPRLRGGDGETFLFHPVSRQRAGGGSTHWIEGALDPAAPSRRLESVDAGPGAEG